MGLDDLSADVTDQYSDLGEQMTVDLDRETRNELAMLTMALEPDEADELVRRAIHMLFQSTVDTGKLDFQLRTAYDVTYDEYLSGMTYDEMTGNVSGPSRDESDRRYNF